MGNTVFNPNTALDLAKFQGGIAGAQAGHAGEIGVSIAPTSVFNQAGYTVMQDTDTGYLHLEKTGDESLFSGKWYDQNSGVNYDVYSSSSNVNNSNSATQNTAYTTTDLSAQQQNISDIYGYVNPNSVVQSNNDYPWSQGYTLEDASDVYTNGSDSEVDGEAAENDGISAEQIQELVDMGIYKNTNEALQVTLASGYKVSDEEQSKLGLYNTEDESKIETMMDVYGLSRNDAINCLNGKIAESGANTYAKDLEEELNKVEDKQGFLGKAWNGIKTFFGAGTKYDDAKGAIEKYQKGEISYDEAKNKIEEYGEKQDEATAGIKTGAAVVAGTVAGIFTGGIGGVAVGSAVKTALGVADRASNNNSEDDFSSEILKDAVTGALDGAVGGIGGRTVHAAGRGIKLAVAAGRTAAGIGTIAAGSELQS